MGGNIKHAFPGGNTSKGFVSFYDYILPQDEARRIIIIKGGPGVGKSTFMKKIAEEMLDRGYDVEFMHCSSDNNSLDGLVIPSIKVAMIDGTAPHIVDPKNPGCIDEIINLGEYWNEEGLRKNREQITSINKETGKYFARAYKYLAAAKSIYDDIETIVSEAVNPGKINLVIDDLNGIFFKDRKTCSNQGKERHLFGSAITPDGLKNYVSSLIANQKNIVVLKGMPGTGLQKITAKIAEAALANGLYIECYHCPMNPERIEHIVIPELEAAVTVSNSYHQIEVKDAIKVIDMNELMDERIFNKYDEEIMYDKLQFDNMLNRAVSTIAKAKALHDKMETYYIPNMNFNEVQKVWEKTLNRILKFEEEIYC